MVRIGPESQIQIVKPFTQRDLAGLRVPGHAGYLLSTHAPVAVANVSRHECFKRQILAYDIPKFPPPLFGAVVIEESLLERARWYIFTPGRIIMQNNTGQIEECQSCRCFSEERSQVVGSDSDGRKCSIRS